MRPGDVRASQPRRIVADATPLSYLFSLHLAPLCLPVSCRHSHRWGSVSGRTARARVLAERRLPFACRGASSTARQAVERLADGGEAGERDLLSGSERPGRGWRRSTAPRRSGTRASSSQLSIDHAPSPSFQPWSECSTTAVVGARPKPSSESRTRPDAAGLVALLGELDDRIAAMAAELEGGPAAPEIEEEGSEIWEEASLPGPRISVGPRSDRTHSYELEAAPTDAALRLPRLESFKI